MKILVSNMKMISALSVATLAMLTMASTSSASVVISIQNVGVTDNSNGSTVNASVFGNSTDGDALVSYNLPIEIGNDGRGLPAGFSNLMVSAGTVSTAFQTNFDALNAPAVQNYEFIATDTFGGDGLAFPDGSLELFQISFDLAASVPTNVTFPIIFTDGMTSTTNLFQFDTTDTGLQTALEVTPDTGNIFNAGSVVVTAVPEPSSLVAVGILSTALSLRRRRRK